MDDYYDLTDADLADYEPKAIFRPDAPPCEVCGWAVPMDGWALYCSKECANQADKEVVK